MHPHQIKRRSETPATLRKNSAHMPPACRRALNFIHGLLPRRQNEEIRPESPALVRLDIRAPVIYT